MSTLSLQITYRKGQPFAAYIYLAGRPGQRSARTVEVSPEVLIDYAADGTPLGIEIISPMHVSAEEVNRAFDVLGLSRPSAVELAPLRAA
ncbi:MAG TPA: DUF2283 domain-containing protein [Longimicrobiales bacterium]|nr:DUF2283 domain-containing protein [Longimicrobiales bacterium]